MNCRHLHLKLTARPAADGGTSLLFYATVSLAPLRGARRALSGKGKHILVLLAPPAMRAKQRKTPKIQILLIPVHPSLPIILWAAPPPRSQGPLGLGLADVLVNYFLFQSLPRYAYYILVKNVSSLRVGSPYPLRSRRLICWPVSPTRRGLARGSPHLLYRTLVQRSFGLRARL